MTIIWKIRFVEAQDLNNTGDFGVTDVTHDQVSNGNEM